MRLAVIAGGLLGLTGCGYHSVYAAPAGAMSLRPVQVLAHDTLAALEVEHGVRETLAREGALATRAVCPCVTVEVLRVDRAAGAMVDRGGMPSAISQVTAIVARATVDDGQGRTLFDTGDARAETHFVSHSAAADALQGDDATKAAARRLGRVLGARLLGHPAASEEAEGASL